MFILPLNFPSIFSFKLSNLSLRPGLYISVGLRLSLNFPPSLSVKVPVRTYTDVDISPLINLMFIVSFNLFVRTHLDKIFQFPCPRLLLSFPSGSFKFNFLALLVMFTVCPQLLQLKMSKMSSVWTLAASQVRHLWIYIC